MEASICSGYFWLRSSS